MEVSDSGRLTSNSSPRTMSRMFMIVSLLFATCGIVLGYCNHLTKDKFPFFCIVFVIMPLGVSVCLTLVRSLGDDFRRCLMYGCAVVGLGVLCIYRAILWQEDKYVACVLRAYKDGGDYQSVAKSKSFLVGDEVEAFVCRYILELKTIDAFLARIDEANKIPAGDFRDKILGEIEGDVLASKRRMILRLEHIEVADRYSKTASDSLTSIYRNIEDLCRRKRGMQL